jgi:hypothetical protein
MGRREGRGGGEVRKACGERGPWEKRSHTKGGGGANGEMRPCKGWERHDCSGTLLSWGRTGFDW